MSNRGGWGSDYGQYWSLRAVFGVALATIPSGCTWLFAPELSAVNLVRVDAVEVGPDSNDPLPSLFERRPGRTMVKVRLAMKDDLAALSARDDPVLLHDKAWICPIGVGQSLAAWGIYEIYEGRAVDIDKLADSYRRHRDRDRAVPENGAYLYDFYFDPRRPRRIASGAAGEPDLEPYDLVVTPQDVCLQLEGVEYTFSAIGKSNVVIVPREAIENAFR